MYVSSVADNIELILNICTRFAGTEQESSFTRFAGVQCHNCTKAGDWIENRPLIASQPIVRAKRDRRLQRATPSDEPQPIRFKLKIAYRFRIAVAENRMNTPKLRIVVMPRTTTSDDRTSLLAKLCLDE